ncbi:ubiquitin-conjugating enzyme E2 S [Capronia coronata CBS 617.96]|uniref:Ubiquitin-conjugating enzyme E2 2 n=1 Tax=Capronia coronata CBS 617.96 TaxID=1182541 RepID=W9XZY9_9EURO|nr:ubiquitin-conjugating enzyme E2 S [Capronia coronata CBS 617.96]EXJ86127.1 ubiquitin-conjugating enzyme E2 S [Capronia coronata CBS 617.96]
MASSFRRLAKDFAALQSSLPPNYLFPANEDASHPDDLTQLVVLVTGAEGTPYSQGLWRLHLKMPHDYPKSPPKATFKTRIYHPNVEETTGAVCLETLKRDWDPKLTLKDILVTISCLLIQPNPDSALNAAAGSLIQEDYEAFSTQAKLMTSIHAPIPRHLLKSVHEAKRRGEEEDDRVIPKKSARIGRRSAEETVEDNMKENDPEQNIACAAGTGGSARGKRPFSELPSPAEGAQHTDDHHNELHAPENSWPIHSDSEPGQPVRKSPKLTRTGASNIETTSQSQIYAGDEGKENAAGAKVSHVAQGPLESRPAPLRKVSNVGARRKGQPRVGIRRL